MGHAMTTMLFFEEDIAVKSWAPPATEALLFLSAIPSLNFQHSTLI